jgi:hypothetical protein
MNYEPKDYEAAKQSLRRKMLPGVVIFIILAICLFLMFERKNAPTPPVGAQQQTPAATQK